MYLQEVPFTFSRTVLWKSEGPSFSYSAARQLVVGGETENVFLLEAYQDLHSEEAILRS